MCSWTKTHNMHHDLLFLVNRNVIMFRKTYEMYTCIINWMNDESTYLNNVLLIYMYIFTIIKYPSLSQKCQGIVVYSWISLYIYIIFMSYSDVYHLMNRPFVQLVCVVFKVLLFQTVFRGLPAPLRICIRPTRSKQTKCESVVATWCYVVPQDMDKKTCTKSKQHTTKVVRDVYL